MIFEYVQYLRPDGRQVIRSAEAPDELLEKYKAIHDAGCVLAAEVLTTGHVSLTVEAPDDAGDFMIEVVPNGPEVPKAWERMLEQFDTDELDAWLAEMWNNE
jgi:hypothetical protein